MGTQAEALRVVLDTNVVLSALLFPSGRLGGLRSAWQRRAFVPLVDNATAAELLRALGYPKFRLDEAAIHALLGEYLPFAEAVPAGRVPRGLPRCADPDDQKFLELAARGKAHCVVSGDAVLLRVAGALAFEILTPDAFWARFDTGLA